MTNLSVEVGRVVLSTAGRDKDGLFLITEVIDGEYVYIADGDVRRLSAPKKKKVKHLWLKPVILEGIADKLKTGKKVFDAELRGALKGANEKGE